MGDRVEVFPYPDEPPERLDKFLVRCLPEFSRTRLQGLIAEGFVRVNGQPARKAGMTVEPGMVVEVRIPPLPPIELAGETIPLEIVFENEDLLVINKPAGMVVHPAAGHDSGTLVHAVLGYEPDVEGEGLRPGVVHRLDRDTSGLIVLARTEQAHRFLQDQFRLRQVVKTYLALVDGAPPTPSGRVEAPIGRDPRDRKKMAVMPLGKGREAISEYRTRERFRRHTLLEVRPLTGRTHQIRLHCAFLGCPVVGDVVYGRKKPTLPIGRHFLHAAALEIRLPGESRPRRFEAPLPAELEQALRQLREEGSGRG